MEFPDAEAVADALPPVSYPEFARVSYDPATPSLGDVGVATRDAVDALPLGQVSSGGTVAVGVGSRGVTDGVTVVESVVAELDSRGYDPVVVPAMGSHGGATAAGQRRTLASLGVTEEAVGCPIDADMATVSLGESAVDHEVHVAESAVDADGVVVVNRVKPHTNFTGDVESGLSKMLAVGLGKQAGAKAFHERALVAGYEPTVRAAVERIVAEAPILGGVAVVENFRDETALVEGVPAAELPDAETPLLERAREWMPTLPFDDLDALVLDRIGKDVSGAGMDTNVVGRYHLLNVEEPETPDIDRILVRGLTERTHGNAIGLGLADVTTRDVVEAANLDETYTNALTSNSLSKAHLPLVLPTEELALRATLTTNGPYDPETASVVWARDTSHLSEFRVSAALVEDPPANVTVEARERLRFSDGDPVFEEL